MREELVFLHIEEEMLTWVGNPDKAGIIDNFDIFYNKFYLPHQ